MSQRYAKPPITSTTLELSRLELADVLADVLRAAGYDIPDDPGAVTVSVLPERQDMRGEPMGYGDAPMVRITWRNAPR